MVKWLKNVKCARPLCGERTAGVSVTRLSGGVKGVELLILVTRLVMGMMCGGSILRVQITRALASGV